MSESLQTIHCDNCSCKLSYPRSATFIQCPKCNNTMSPQAALTTYMNCIGCGILLSHPTSTSTIQCPKCRIIMELPLGTDSTKSTGSRKTRKKKRDPYAPKRASNAYMIFCKEKRSQLKESRPDLPFGKLGASLGEIWRTMSSEEKKPYETRAFVDRERYRKEMALYHQCQADTHPDFLGASTAERDMSPTSPTNSPRNMVQSAFNNPNPPKRPRTSNDPLLLSQQQHPLLTGSLSLPVKTEPGMQPNFNQRNPLLVPPTPYERMQKLRQKDSSAVDTKTSSPMDISNGMSPLPAHGQNFAQQLQQAQQQLQVQQLQLQAQQLQQAQLQQAQLQAQQRQAQPAQPSQAQPKIILNPQQIAQMQQILTPQQMQHMQTQSRSMQMGSMSLPMNLFSIPAGMLFPSLFAGGGQAGGMLLTPNTTPPTPSSPATRSGPTAAAATAIAASATTTAAVAAAPATTQQITPAPVMTPSSQSKSEL